MKSAPTFVEVDADYSDLLSQSDWRLQKRTDLTAEFLQFMRAELEGMKARADALARVFGRDEFSARLTRQQAGIAAIDSGFLRRELFVAVNG